jgi:hypothetical protein
MSDATTPHVSCEIQDAYSEIGRNMVETAIQQARAAWNVPEESVEATVTIRLVFGSQVGGRVPTTCCVCTRESKGVWVCAGPCCPSRNPQW